MLEASESIAISVERYDALLEDSADLKELIKAVMDNASISLDKTKLVLDMESSQDLMTLIRIKYPLTYSAKLDHMLAEGVDTDAGD